MAQKSAAMNYSEDEFLEALSDAGGESFVSDIKDAVGCDRTTAWRRLNELAEKGLVEKERVGGSVDRYTITPEGERRLNEVSN